jgi:DNA-binding transcriptional LysR family regulator
LHLGYAPSPTARILPQALRAFQASVPKVRVRLHDLSSEEMLLGLREGRLQLAFIVQPAQSRLRGLEFRELARDIMCIAVPPGHPLARSRKATLAQAAREPLVAFSHAEYPEYHEYLAALFHPAKLRPRISEEHDSSTSMVAAIESGAGIAVVPQSFSCSAGSRLVLVPLSPPPAPLVIGVAWSQATLTPAAEQFLQLLPLSEKEKSLA